ncbi:sorbosone dehydrogenase [Methylotenera oryzisoli]|uniref:Sorbosone dehydrogenase n=2 Tax=Methylotenera oryzisoli TaxID=2080758 RepID=A0A4Y9VP87_9PROT|nr:sorbosone dehydrogenase family protein [Methylotenera oryzisoli]TFW70183.1 sorbosone dehydrogenase [Methylotenera oryzisoli]
MKPLLLSILSALVMSACGESAKHDISTGMGAQPTLPEPVKTLIPTVHVAAVVGWNNANKPNAAPGLKVSAFAAGLEHPRWLYELPNGDILVAETNFEMQGLEGSIKGWFAKYFLTKAGATGVSPDRISLLRDADGNGEAETKTTFIEGLHSPFGMALIGNTFYVANADSIVSFPYKNGESNIKTAPTKLIDLPGLPLNHHWTKNILANADGTKLYVTVGSNSNIGENGMDIEKDRAAILEVDIQAKNYRTYASGLRNPNGLALESETKQLWTVVNERDEIGSDLVPDYLTSVQENGFYGWPYSYYGQHVDQRVQPQNPELVAKAIKPDYALGAHTASLGLADAKGNNLGAQYAQGMFIGQHGSWNRRPYSGYRVIFIPFAGGKPSGKPIDVLTDFIDANGDAQGRPVGVLVQKTGSLLVADDAGNRVWRVSAQ